MGFVQADHFTLRGYECDSHGRLSVPALMNLMQESANRNAVDYGIGIADLARRGFGWMLMRFRLRMHRYPRYRQTIRVVTYPTVVEKYFIHRDFKILTDDGTLLADAVSTWLVFDTGRRAMVPLPAFIRSMDVPEAVEPMLKLPLKPDFQQQSFADAAERWVEVGWLSIDQNQHVNNVAYVGWLLESVDDQLLDARELAEIDLVYRTESHWHDSLRVRTLVETDDARLHQITLADKEVLLARSRWRSTS